MELTYKNQEGASVTLRQMKPLFLTRLDGAGRIRQTINTFRAPEQDGAFYISSTLDMRNITIEGQIIAPDVDASFEYRRHLLRIFTPKQRGTLIYRDRQISCIVEEAGVSQGNISRAPTFFISLLCPSPFFEALEMIREELASWQGKFEFPLEITLPGIEFGVRQPSQIITIENEGDVPCGCEVRFSALGELTNPELLNVDTGEVFRLHKTFAAGETVQVYTHFAEKRVMRTLGGTTSNAFNDMDSASTFIQLEPGTNTLRYHTDSNLDALEVQVLFRPLYLGA